ncbi:MAG: hypothetical protein ACP5G1_03985 [Nanopusillaceae archaeon]
MKLQTGLISYLLIGLLVAAIAIGVYEWGIPMIQKSQLQNTINSVNTQLSSVANTISNVANGKGSTTESLNLPQGTITIEYDQIKYTFEVPTTYFNPSVSFVPINYNIYIPCGQNNTVYVNGGTVQLCGVPTLLVYANNTNIVIQDVNNVTKIFPLTNIKYLITQYYVFNVNVNGNQVTFIPIYNTAIVSSSLYPPCIVNANQQEGLVTYTITCRPVYDPVTGQCHWIKLVPTGQNSVTTNKIVNLNIQYNRMEVINDPNSTVCNQLIQYYITSSIV